jgi:hypothetical protein
LEAGRDQIPASIWRGARAAESERLESVCGGNVTVGSNPTLSADRNTRWPPRTLREAVFAKLRAGGAGALRPLRSARRTQAARNRGDAQQQSVEQRCGRRLVACVSVRPPLLPQGDLVAVEDPEGFAAEIDVGLCPRTGLCERPPAEASEHLAGEGVLGEEPPRMSLRTRSSATSCAYSFMNRGDAVATLVAALATR